MTDIPEDIRAEARKAIYDDGRGMIGRNRNYLEHRVARAIFRAIAAERSRQIERDAKIADAEVSQWVEMCEAHPDSGWECAVDACRDIADLIRGQEP